LTTSPKEIRGLSVRQPWAWGICTGLKRTENRTWSTDFRGTVAIHASTSPQVVKALRQSSGCELMTHERFEFGAIIGLADITAIASYGPQHEADPFAEGPYCWTLEHARFLRTPIPLKGKLNLFKIAPAIQQQLREAETYLLDLKNDPDAAAIAKAMTAEPDPVQSYTELFFEHLNTGNHQQAVAAAGERLIQLAPQQATSYVVRAWSRLSSGDATGAIADALRGVELDAGIVLGWATLTDAYLDLAQYPEACEAADRMVQAAPDDPYSYSTRAHALFYAKRYSASLADCERWIKIDPQDFRARTARADVRAALGDRTGAMEDLAEAERIAPGEPFIAEVRQRLTAAG
jgi:hypothetical protein